MRSVLTIILLGCCSLVFAQQKKKTRAPQAHTATARTGNAYTISHAANGFCTGGTLTLTGSPAQPSGYLLQWTLNGNPISGQTSLTHAASQAGAYSLYAYRAPSDTIRYDTVNVVEFVKPVPAYTFDNDNTCSGTDVHFSGSASSGTPPYSYSWDFGDGSAVSTLQNPTKAFTSLGCGTATFNVKLTVTDANGCTGVITRVVTVKQKPDVQMKDTQNPFNEFSNCSNAPTAANPNFTVKLSNVSPSASCISTYTVDWGDGNIQTGLTGAAFPLQHTYTQLGEFPLKVTATASNGCTNTWEYHVANQTNPAVGISAPGNTSGCAPVGFTFTLTPLQNSPGTTYTWNFGDGTSQVTWLADTVTVGSIFHNFLNTSCDQAAGQFTVKVTARNGCDATEATVNNVRIFKKPVANFSASVTACVNSSVSFTNTSIGAYNQGSCNRNTLYDWNFGDGGTSTATSPTHSYSTPGTYDVRLIAQGSCGNDTIIKQICIVAAPNSSFTIDNNTGCAPFAVTATNTSTSGAACTPPTFGWTTSYTASNCGTGSSVSFTGGSTASSTNASLSFVNPGTYSIVLSVTNACGTVTSSKSVVVKGKPSISFPAPAAACAPATLTPSASVANCGSSALTYQWDFTDGNPATSTSLNPGAVSFPTTGSHAITLSATNECGTSQVPRTFVVNESPELTIPANASYCTGSSVPAMTFTSSTPGASISWTAPSSPSIGMASSGGSSIAAFTASNGGTTPIIKTITVTASIGGCTTTKTFTITVWNKPATPVVTSPVTYCQNAPATALTATVGASQHLVWYPGGATAPTPSTATVGSIVYQVAQVNDTTGCEGNRAGITVQVNASPSITAVTPSNPTSCATSTGSLTLTGLLFNTSYTVSYTKNGGAPVVGTRTSTASGNIIISNLGAGTYDNITVTINGCTSLPMGPVTLSDPNPPAVPTATVVASPVCTGGSFQLFASSSTPGVTYTWSGPASYSSTQQNPTLNSVGLGASGTYSVTATLAGCSSPAGTVAVTINPSPAAPVITAPAVCSGQTLAISASSSTPGVTYAWSGPNSFSDANASFSIPNANTTHGGAYTVTVTLGSCISTGVANAVVKPTPAITGVANQPTSCGSNSGSIVLSGLSAGTYTVNYEKNGAPVSATQTIGGTTLTIANLTAGTYTNVTVSLSSCPSNAVGPFVLSDPNPPAAPQPLANGPLCSGADLQLSVGNPLVGGTYSWTGPNSFSSALQAPQISAAGTAATGTYTVTVTLNGCTSPAATVNATVNQTPAQPVITGNSPVCSGTALSLSAATSTPGAVTWSWTGPGSFSSNQQAISIPAATATDAGSYTVTATLGACSSNRSYTVDVKPTPAIADVQTANPTQCTTPTGNLTLTGLAPNTAFLYTYTQNGTPRSGNGSSNAGGNLAIGGLTSGTYDAIIVVQNGCPSAPVGPYTLSDPNPPQTPVATTGGAVCSGNNLQLHATSVTAGVTFSWSGPNGFSSNSADPVVTAAPMAAAGVYSVTATLNGCTSPAGTVTATVNLTPAVPQLAAPDACSGNALNLSATSSTPGVTYGWTGPNGFGSNQQSPVITPATTAASGTYTATVTLGSCNASNTIVALVMPTPAISGTPANPQACNTATGSIALQTLAPGSYTVSYTYNGTPVTLAAQSPDASGVLSIGNLAAGTYSNISVTLNGCPSNIVGPFVLSDPNPPAAPSVSSNSPLCAGATLNLTSGPVANATYSWTGPNAFASTQQSPVLPNAGINASGVYSLTVTVNNCTSQPATVNVLVNALAAAPVVVSPVEYCKDVPATALTATPSAGGTLNWFTSATGGAPSAVAPVPATSVPGAASWFVSQTSAAGCEGARAEIRVIVHPDADAHYSFTRDTACWPFALPIQNTSAVANNGGYSWYAGVANIGTSVSPAFPGYTLANPSEQVTIKLLATSAFGCKPDSTAHTFYTLPKPQAAFTATPTSGCGPLSVTFTNTTAVIDTFRYAWDFGNGQVSNQQQPGTIVFDAAPTANDTIYTVKLKAFNACDTSTFTMDIRVSSKPKVLFTPDHTIGCSPMRVLFTNNSLGFGNTYTWNFDDGTIVNAPTRDTISHVFHAAVRDTFYVKLYATNGCGIDSAVYSIVVLPNPIHMFMAVNGTQQNGCAPHTVEFVNNSSGATGFQWNFGDGNTLSTTANIDTVTHQFFNAGTYEVHLTAFNGCTDTTMTLLINVYPKPAAAFTADRALACIGDTIHFNNTSVDATSYLWQFGDGNTSTLANPAHHYSLPGTYTVTLQAQRLNPTGSYCTDEVTVTVEIRSGFTGAITVAPTTATCVPFVATFTNPNLPAASSTWNFGDGNNGTGSPVSHTYTQAGQYTATLTSVSPGGCTYTAQQLIRVNAPAGTFTYTGGYVCGTRAVRFDATVSGTDTLIWNFGDGTSQATLQPFVYHSYNNPGLYLPTVTLATTGGCRLQLSGVDTIRVDRIVNGFMATQARSCGATDVTFSDTAHVYFGRTVVAWDFGDGTGATGSPVVHRYTNSGTYQIRQIVFSNSGCSDTLYRNITVQVNSQPVASIAANALGCTNHPEPLTATVQSVDPIATYQWSVNGTVVSNTNPYTPNFVAAGTYNIRLVVATVNGCFDTAFHTLQVRPSPVVVATASLDLCLGGSTQLNASGNGVVQWSWSPAQGLSCTTCPNPVATPNATTPYIVTGTNSVGCTGTATVVITIHGPIHMNVTADDTICVGQSVQLLASGAASYVWRPNQYLSHDSIPNPVATPPVTTRYQVVGYDGWNCYTDTGYVNIAVGQYPTVNLGPDLVLATGVQRPMVTTVTNGPIRNWSWAPAADLSCSNCPLPTATIRNDVRYTVEVTNFYGCTGSDTLLIRAFCKETQLFLPNAFSPDGDGVNDVFMVQGSGILRVKTFRIFNRWGELVFEKNEVPPNEARFGWDGRVIGRPPVPDVYVYTVEVLCENGTPYTYKGNVTILK